MIRGLERQIAARELDDEGGVLVRTFSDVAKRGKGLLEDHVGPLARLVFLEHGDIESGTQADGTGHVKLHLGDLRGSSVLFALPAAEFAKQ